LRRRQDAEEGLPHTVRSRTSQAPAWGPERARAMDASGYAHSGCVSHGPRPAVHSAMFCELPAASDAADDSMD
jgi:hypothetical protein